MFTPRIGRGYPATRILILGESAYSWPEHGVWQHPLPDHSSTSVEWAIDNFQECVSGNRFLTTVSRALANEYAPTKDQLRLAWSRVAFTNYISTTVGDGAPTRPTAAMWAAAKRDFLPDVQREFKLLLPNRIIVLGKEVWGHMPDRDIRHTADVQGYRIGEHVMMCSAHLHPRAGLGWQELAAVIHDELALAAASL